jgi:hypothetical protein
MSVTLHIVLILITACLSKPLSLAFKIGLCFRERMGVSYFMKIMSILLRLMK